MPVPVSACATLLSQPYYIPVAGREESNAYAIATEISNQLDPFCSSALLTYACLFIHPPCDPERGYTAHEHTAHWPLKRNISYNFFWIYA